MPFSTEQKLVIGVSSRALFALEEANRVFENNGLQAYQDFQRRNLSQPLAPGPVFRFISELLAFNPALPDIEPIEVVLLSKNDPITGDRIFHSIEHHGLAISRAVFTSGRSLHHYLDAFDVALYLSADADHVAAARAEGWPAGCVQHHASEWSMADGEIRIAFDFDGVLASDESQRVFERFGLETFHTHEITHRTRPLEAGPLYRLLHKLGELQSLLQHARIDRPRLRISIVTSRSAPATRRLIRTLDSWGIVPDDAFFLGGLEKRRILKTLRPHIFFDDQYEHLHDVFAAVHIPPVAPAVAPAVDAAATRQVSPELKSPQRVQRGGMTRGESQSESSDRSIIAPAGGTNRLASNDTP
ncbi:MAG: 5'-nucleotidase [Myxococcota bacterium]